MCRRLIAMAPARSHIALCLLLVLMTAHYTIALQGTVLPMRCSS